LDNVHFKEYSNLFINILHTLQTYVEYITHIKVNMIFKKIDQR
jgi:hypothetical protein